VADGGSGVNGLTGGGSLRQTQTQTQTQNVAAQVSLAAAAQAAHENFPVALRVLPARYTRHLMALYGFARLTDDIGDEPLPGQPDATAEDRIAVLDALEADVHRIYTGQTPQLAAIRELGRTVRACDVPEQPLTDLIEANRQDQRVARYATFEDLVQYCVLSANTIGRVVLHIFGVATPEREALSDSICTALQLAEHWQDVAEDLRNGRVYLPGEDLDRFGCTEADLARPTASQPVRDLLAFETDRAMRMLDEGARLAGTLRHGAGRLAIAGYVAGGRAALKSIADGGYDVLRATPRPGKKDTLTGMIRCYVRGR
jgi:squalene synthase HpnC